MLLLAGARPNFMKIAPLVRAFRARGTVAARLVHTGQHYDEALSARFFRELDLPEPEANLGVGSGTHAAQTAAILQALEPILRDRPPRLLILVGDVNSTLAGALVAAKQGVPIAHVEAGLRSFDRTMPEEVNRIVTDALARELYVTEASGRENLRREGHPEDHIHLAGNVMVDTLLEHLPRARERAEAERAGLTPGGFAVATLHRPANVDYREPLARILRALARLGEDLPIVVPLHPRTRARIQAFGLEGIVPRGGGVRLVEPLGYLAFLGLFADARFVLTDSGGIQEEAVILQVPCLTLRENTERPVTIEVGGNVLVGSDEARILEAARPALEGSWGTIKTPPAWDGHAAARIVERVEAFLAREGG